MGDYNRTKTMPIDAEVLFDYLKDVDNLPQYFPMITSVQKRPGDEVATTAEIAPPGQEKHAVSGVAWFKVDDGSNKVSWGSKDESNYQGQIEVASQGSGSEVTFSMHTDHDHDGIDDGIDQTLDKIAELSAKGVPEQ